MHNQTKDKWDKHYNSCSSDYPAAAEVLFKNQHLLPVKENGQATALDLACGRGANAICLAENGLSVSAWDVSPVALEQLSPYATEKKLIIKSEVRDVSAKPPETNTFDVIVVSHFLDRPLIPKIKNAIKANGLIFYQTFIKERVNESGPKNPDYRLDNNELLIAFNDWDIILYCEEGKTGNTELGFRNQAMLIAKKPHE